MSAIMISGYNRQPFNPVTLMSPHSVFWAGGPVMRAQGYADSDPVTLWPNEVGEVNASGTAGATFVAADVNSNNQPSVLFGAGNDLKTAAFSTSPDYTVGVSLVVMGYTTASGGNAFLVDGIEASNRNAIFKGNTRRVSFHAGVTLQTDHNVGGYGGFHSYVAFFDGDTGDDTLHFDGGPLLSGAAGAHQLTGLTLGNDYSLSAPHDQVISFIGLYEGENVVTREEWPTFQAWASGYYGVAI